MSPRRAASIVLASLSFWLAAAQAAPSGAPVSVQSGKIVLTRNGAQIVLTKSGRDTDPVLSPDGRIVVFTRGRPQDQDAEDCSDDSAAKVELWAVGADGRGERKLLDSRSAKDPKFQVCHFGNKQFSSNGKRLYFESKGWATSAALHMYDFASGKERFVAPENDYLVLANCERGEYRDAIAVGQHRYFVFGGSYDWYWLLSADGTKELGPLGENLAMAKEECGLKSD